MVASLGAFDMLEPYTVKVVRAVLRGRGGGDATLLSGFTFTGPPGTISARSLALG